MCIPRSLRQSAIWTVAVCLSVLCTALPSAAQAPYSRIVVFGDSLSDTGNGFALTRANATPPDYTLNELFIPNAPYARGGHHLSNGATWIEYLARPLGLAGSVKPAFGSAARSATNYAVGTARARAGQTVSLADQVAMFLAEFGGVAPSDALYVIEIGGNDIRDALVAFPFGGSDAILAAAIDGIVAAITALHEAGARNVLVWDVPNIALTPAVRIAAAQNPTLPIAFIATQLTTAFNTALTAVISQLTALPGINLTLFAASDLVAAMVVNPAGFGLVDVENPCVTPNVPPFSCSNPDAFLFWDGLHPTTAVHAIFAAEVALLLGL